MSLINFPILYINDPLVGKPLFRGKIFAGIPGLDPEDGNGNPMNSKQLRVVLEDGSKVNVGQPFELSQGGNPVYNGKTVRLDVDGNFSIKILNNNNVQKYYIENVFEGQPVTELDLINDRSQTIDFATVAEYKDFTTALPVGKVVNILERDAGFTVIAGTGTADELSIIANTNTTQSIDYIKGAVIPAKAIGVIGDDSNDDTSAILAAIALLPSGGEVIFNPEFICKITSVITLPNRVVLNLNNGAVIKQYTNDTNIISLASAATGSSRQQVKDGRLQYNAQQTTVAGSAVLLADATTVTTRWLLSNLAISKAYHATYVPDGSNVYLAGMEDVTSTDSDDYAFYFGGAASVHTNIKLNNIWAFQTPGSERPNGKGFKLQNIQELDASNLAVDNAQGIPVQVLTCKGVISNISIESCDRTLAAGTGYHIGVFGSQVDIGTILATANNVTISGSGNMAVLYTASSSNVECFAITDNDTTLTDTSSGSYYTIYNVDAGDRVWNKKAISTDGSPAISINDTSDNSPKRVRELNGAALTLELEGLQFATKTITPSGTNFDEGTVVWSRAPALGTAQYWRLTGTDWIQVGGVTIKTTTEIEDITNDVNTKGKYEARQIFNTTTNKPLWASGGTAGNSWRDATGSSVHTPA